MNAIPGIGCFEVDAGKRATGTVAGGQLTITVSERGDPTCSLDTDAIQCNGCVTRSDPACPTQLLIVTHNPDGSVLFSVQRKADGNRYIYSQQIWDTWQRFQHPSASEVSEQQHLARLVSATANPTDGPAALAAVGFRAQRAYAAEAFADLDELIEQLSQAEQLTDDGMPRALGISRGLSQFLDAWKSWKSDLDRVARWRSERPDSYGPDLVEVIIWRQWAWNARGVAYASTVTPEGWKLFNQRLARADEVLNRSKPVASKSPLWYQLRLAVDRDMGVDRKRVQPIFDEATRRFPWYVVYYQSLTDYLSPKWGGSYEAVDTFARQSVNNKLGSDHSLYTRVYWLLTDGEGPEFEPFRDSMASWSLMKTGFEGLMQRYPNSFWNLNTYAAFACRANDGPTYAALRTKIGLEVIPNAWPSNHSTDVCDERLLGRT
jgi:hypothetical protein